MHRSLLLCALATACGPPYSASPAPPAPSLPTALPASSQDAGPSPQQKYTKSPNRPAAATFEVTPTSALIWAYAPEPTTARILLQNVPPPTADTDPPPDRLVWTYLIDLTDATGRTGVVDVPDLTPDTPYRYRLQLGYGIATSWYHFRTAPADDADATVHFLYSADISNDPIYHTDVLDRLATTGAAFFLSLGDWPYTDIPIRDITVEQYRASHRVARVGRTFEPWLRSMPVFAIYDDHEIRDNWDAAWAAEDPARFHAGLQVWDEFFPLRRTSADAPRYRSFRWGRHAEFFVLDTRMYRSAYRDPDGPDKTMLGAEQLAWLQAGLATSTATFKLVVCTVPLDFGSTKEHWNAYAYERTALLQAIEHANVRGLVFLTADQHWFAVHHYDNGLKEFQTGPLMAFLRDPPAERPPQVKATVRTANYGEVMITGGQHPALTFTARDSSGRLLWAEVVSP